MPAPKSAQADRNFQQRRRLPQGDAASSFRARRTDSRSEQSGSLSLIDDVPLDESARTPRQTWNDYFSKHRPPPRNVGRLILQLHDASKHEQVIAAIEAALINGQSQPWMYDVLAVSMEIVGRPKDEIERVLLSRVDFTATDVPSMIYSAAYLTRFGAEKQALRLYRQASRLAPTRPEPFVLGLRLARRANDYESIRWAAVGILTTAWTRDYERLHREAETALRAAQQDLHEQGRHNHAAEMATALGDALKRDLVLELAWNGHGDLDLIVEEPSGTVCSFDFPQSPGGGVLVRDGYGPQQKNCYEKYVCARGAAGNYRVRINHAWGDIVGKRARLTVTRYKGSSHESVQSFPIQLAEHDRIVWIALPHGRRSERRPVEGGGVSKLDPRLMKAAHPASADDAHAVAAAREFARSRRRRSGGAPVGSRAGNFSAVGFQPIVALIPDGVSMNASAVVSADRRYVHISATPVFTALSDVFTFSFINTGNPVGNPGLGGGNPQTGN